MYFWYVGMMDHTVARMAKHTPAQNTVQWSVRKDLIVIFGNAKENVHVQVCSVDGTSSSENCM